MHTYAPAFPEYKMASSTASPSNPNRSYRGIGPIERKVERRERFLNAAIQCFGHHGYHATTLKALCGEASLTERYFYESFAHFDEILCCAYQKAAESVFDIVLASVVGAEVDPAIRARLALDSYFKAIAADPARARLILIEIEGASENANQAYRARLRVTSNMICKEIFKGLPDRPESKLSLDLLSTAFLGAVYQLAKEWTLSNFELPRATIVRNLEAVIAGIGKEWLAQPSTTKTETKDKEST